MISIWVNNREVPAEDGETILSALNRASMKIPTLCNIRSLMPTGSCRICVVELAGRPARLVPACSHPVSPGLRILTHSERVIKARRNILELLLGNHPDDCLYCGKNSSCQLRALAEEYGIREKYYASHPKNARNIDLAAVGIVRDQAKCILCGKCVRICREIQKVAAIDFNGRGTESTIGPAFNKSINVSECVNCGQCVTACPTGALMEKSSLQDVIDALNDPGKIVVIQYAPSLAYALCDELSIKYSTDFSSLLNTLLRMIGFRYVFDSSSAADLTVAGLSDELYERFAADTSPSKNGTPETHHKRFPVIYGCSPAITHFIAQFYPDLLPCLSKEKTPQVHLGSLAKRVFCETHALDPEQIFCVEVMPCTAVKNDAAREKILWERETLPNIDAVLTARELASLLRMHAADPSTFNGSLCDPLFPAPLPQGKIFSPCGSLAESLSRSIYRRLTGKQLKSLKLEQLRTLQDWKETMIKFGDFDFGIASVNGLGNAAKLLEQLRAGRSDLHFVELLACPGGCVGCGQSYRLDAEKAKTRLQAIYSMEQTEAIRSCQDNSGLELYRNEERRKTEMRLRPHSRLPYEAEKTPSPLAEKSDSGIEHEERTRKEKMKKTSGEKKNNDE